RESRGGCRYIVVYPPIRESRGQGWLAAELLRAHRLGASGRRFYARQRAAPGAGQRMRSRPKARRGQRLCPAAKARPARLRLRLPGLGLRVKGATRWPGEVKEADFPLKRLKFFPCIWRKRSSGLDAT